MSTPERTVPIVNIEERTGIITEAWYNEFFGNGSRIADIETTLGITPGDTPTLQTSAGSDLLLSMLYGSL